MSAEPAPTPAAPPAPDAAPEPTPSAPTPAVEEPSPSPSPSSAPSPSPTPTPAPAAPPAEPPAPAAGPGPGPLPVDPEAPAQTQQPPSESPTGAAGDGRRAGVNRQKSYSRLMRKSVAQLTGQRGYFSKKSSRNPEPGADLESGSADGLGSSSPPRKNLPRARSQDGAEDRPTQETYTQETEEQPPWTAGECCRTVVTCPCWIFILLFSFLERFTCCRLFGRCVCRAGIVFYLGLSTCAQGFSTWMTYCCSGDCLSTSEKDTDGAGTPLIT